MYLQMQIGLNFWYILSYTDIKKCQVMIVAFFCSRIRQEVNGLLQASIGNLHPRYPNLSCTGFLFLDISKN